MTQQRPFRFGIQGRTTGPGNQWLAMVRRCEELGHSSFLALDHFVRGLDPIAATAAAAAITTNLRVGSIVFDNDFRHPAILAKAVASIDVISGGRFELGLGAGWLKEEYDQSGIPFDPVGVRIERMVEALRLMMQTFVEERMTFHGAHYHVTDLQLPPKPVQQPHPPIMLGGGGKRILSIAAREADIVSITNRANPDGSKDNQDLIAEATDRKLAWIREAAGERFPKIELNAMCSTVVVTRDRAREAERLASEFGLTPEQVLGSPIMLVGTVDQMVEALLARRERWGFSYVVVTIPFPRSRGEARIRRNRYRRK
ncbi:MAG: TIGR03621 family F420-dependent LLM class oxidoreductase [Thermomicrobiales bacterium]